MNPVCIIDLLFFVPLVYPKAMPAKNYDNMTDSFFRQPFHITGYEIGFILCVFLVVWILSGFL
jgi:hypothetical protein